MKERKGFNFSVTTVLVVVIGLLAALTIVSLVNDGTSSFLGFSNTTSPSGGFVNGS